MSVQQNALSLGVESPQVHEDLRSMPIPEDVLGNLDKLKKFMKEQDELRAQTAEELMNWAQGKSTHYDPKTGNRIK